MKRRRRIGGENSPRRYGRILLLALVLRPSSLSLAFPLSPLGSARGLQRLWESTQKEEKHKVSTEETSQNAFNSSLSRADEVSTSRSPPPAAPLLLQKPVARKKKMELMWCDEDSCTESIRERIVGEHNQIFLNGPATGQVAFFWGKEDSAIMQKQNSTNSIPSQPNKPITQCVLLLVKKGRENDSLLRIAAEAVTNLTLGNPNLQILLDPGTAARLKHYHGVDGDQIHLFEPIATPGFGENLKENPQQQVPSELPILAGEYIPDLICTVGGDGLLMHAGMLFQGPTPPILCVSGGSLGFLTPFQPDELVEAVQVALGLISASSKSDIPGFAEDIHVYPPNMPSYPYEPLSKKNSAAAKKHKFTFGHGGRICLSIRMRLDCRIINREGRVKVRYNVLNEVVIDRGISPYLAALECFCDDVHLTTVQADGVIFATPTGSTAYSMAAGSSVVHPAVPCILVTPICPHVLSFRSMVFPDHVVLRCYVPDDARAEASVAFDGKHRQELRRGYSVQIQMSEYPVPTINRKDHSADWLYGLKRDFNFNARTRQGPL